jgi:hypothetical protein
MIDAEVARLRRLRHVALRVRATLRALGGARIVDSRRAPVPASGESATARGALSCWCIAKVATGQLQAHPYLRYQRGHGLLKRLMDHLAGIHASFWLGRRGHNVQRVASELHRVARELNDVRALTRSAELSDNLGRAQAHLKAIIDQFDAACVRLQPPPQVAHASRSGVHGRKIAIKVPVADWPYLAI